MLHPSDQSQSVCPVLSVSSGLPSVQQVSRSFWRWPSPASRPPCGPSPLWSWRPRLGSACCPERRPNTCWTRWEAPAAFSSCQQKSCVRVSCYQKVAGSVPLVCMSKCPWARHWTPNCSWCAGRHKCRCELSLSFSQQQLKESKKNLTENISANIKIFYISK